MRRFEELDSLRGIAAVTVIFCHFLLVFPAFDFYHLSGRHYDFLIYSPLHFFWAGHEAVILFFTLSGFVLCISIMKSQTFLYKSYIVKRFCRIYIPYILIMFLSVLASIQLHNHELQGVSDWTLQFWNNGISLKTFLQLGTLILFPSYVANDYNIALWSLVHEMRISIIFPIIVFVVVRIRSLYSIVLALGIAIIGYIGSVIFSNSLLVDGFQSAQYILMFTVGALMAYHVDSLSAWYLSLNRWMKGMLPIIGILLYTYDWWFMYDMRIIHLSLIDDIFSMLGSVIFIICAMNSNRIRHMLHRHSIHYVGSISYSIYLIHGLVLISFLYLLSSYISIAWILVLTFGMTFLFASLYYRTVEQYSIQLGRRLSKRIKS